MATNPLRDQHDVTPGSEDNEQEDPRLSPNVKGEENAVGGSASEPDSDDDTSEMIEELTGEEPVPGVPFTLAEQMEKAERALHGLPDKNESEEKNNE